MYILNGSSSSVAVGYFVGAGSVPVNILNTLTVNSHGVTGQGTFAVVPASGTFTVGFGGLAQNIVSTNTLNVSQQGNVTINAIPAGTNNIGLVTGSLVNIVSTNTLQVQTVGTVAVTPSTGIYQTSGTGTFAVVPASGTFNTALTSGNTLYILTASSGSNAVGYFLGASSVPVNVLNTLNVNTHGVTAVGQLTVTPGTGTWSTSGSSVTVFATAGGAVSVILTTAGVNASTVTIQAPNNNTTPIPVSGSFSATVTFLSTGTVGVATPTVVNMNGLGVSSTTMPGAIGDGKTQIWAGDNIGRGYVTGLGMGVQISSYNTTISSATSGIAANTGGSPAELVLFSSAGVNTYTYLCYCTFTSTVATGGQVFIESPAATTASTNGAGGRFSFGVPGSNQYTGITQGGCMNPFFRSAPNANIYIYQTFDAAHSEPVTFRCQGYTGP